MVSAYICKCDNFLVVFAYVSGETCLLTRHSLICYPFGIKSTL